MKTKDRKIILIPLLLLCLLMSGCRDRGMASQTTGPVTDGTEGKYSLAPDVTVYDEAGTPIQISDLRGKPAVVNFWASWCGPCKGEMPHFQEKYEAHGEEVAFLMIDLANGKSETVETGSAFIREKGYTFPVAYDTTSAAATAYGIYSIPATFFIDAEGRVIAQATGAIDAETLQKGIDMIK